MLHITGLLGLILYILLDFLGEKTLRKFSILNSQKTFLKAVTKPSFKKTVIGHKDTSINQQADQKIFPVLEYKLISFMKTYCSLCTTKFTILLNKLSKQKLFCTFNFNFISFSFKQEFFSRMMVKNKKHKKENVKFGHKYSKVTYLLMVKLQSRFLQVYIFP